MSSVPSSLTLTFAKLAQDLSLRQSDHVCRYYLTGNLLTIYTLIFCRTTSTSPSLPKRGAAWYLKNILAYIALLGTQQHNGVARYAT
jgi:hypothetical protein